MSGKVVHGFYNSLRKAFFVLRIIGVFPITGLLNKNSKLSRYSWITPYTVYHVITVTSITGSFLVRLYDIITSSHPFIYYEGLMIHFMARLAVIFIVRLSFNWKNLMNKIDEIERLLPPFKNGHLVVKNINRVITLLTLFALVDYAFYIIFTVRVQYLCSKMMNEELTVEKYFYVYFGYILDILPYSHATVIWCQIMKVQGTLVFCYIEVLTIAATLYLIFRFRNFNRLMRIKVNKCNQNTKWCDVQAHYTRLTRLVKVVDDVINPFIFLSFLSNLMLSCKIIYDFIHTDLVAIIYNLSVVTFGWSRALTVPLLTSHLHSLSREPLETLHTLPAAAYNIQFQRFMDQVYHTRVCLSGLQFFYVTRGTILSGISNFQLTFTIMLIDGAVIMYTMELGVTTTIFPKNSFASTIIIYMVSTVITYELVLLQLPQSIDY